MGSKTIVQSAPGSQLPVPLLCYFCSKENKVTTLQNVDTATDHTVIVDGVPYGVCAFHEKDFQALKRQKAK